MPGTVQDTKDLTVDKRDKIPVLMCLSGGRREKSRDTGRNPEKPIERD